MGGQEDTDVTDEGKGEMRGVNWGQEESIISKRGRRDK